GGRPDFDWRPLRLLAPAQTVALPARPRGGRTGARLHPLIQTTKEFSMSAQPHTTGADAPPDPRRWLALGILLIANFMNLIDVTIVNVALPSMRDGLGATDSQIEWVIAAYILAFALGLLPFGRLGDILGRTRLF